MICLLSYMIYKLFEPFKRHMKGLCDSEKNRKDFLKPIKINFYI